MYTRNNCPGHGSRQLFPANSEFDFSGVFDVFDVTPFLSVSVANFEHIFVSWVRCEQRYMITNCCLAESKPRLKIILKLLNH